MQILQIFREYRELFIELIHDNSLNLFEVFANNS
jgi:hypothetical protein